MADAPIDLVRWSFTVDPARRAAVEEYLSGLGLDVLVRDDSHFLVSWDEPEGDLDEVIETIWAIHGVPFEVTQEEFHRQIIVRLDSPHPGGRKDHDEDSKAQ